MFLGSLVVALLLGLLVGFVHYVASVQGAVRFDPPLSEDELRRLSELPAPKAEELLASRRKTLTRGQWVRESIGHSFFWNGVAKDSIVPALGIFAGCMVIGGLLRHDRGSQ
jgi:hypothetical protein